MRTSTKMLFLLLLDQEMQKKRTGRRTTESGRTQRDPFVPADTVITTTASPSKPRVPSGRIAREVDDEGEKKDKKEKGCERTEKRRGKRRAGKERKKGTSVKWTAAEDEALLKAIAETHETAVDVYEEDWDLISESLPGKSAVQCLQRYIQFSKKEGKSGGTAATPPAPVAAITLDSDSDEEEESGDGKSKDSKRQKTDDQGGKPSSDNVEFSKQANGSAPKRHTIAANYYWHNNIGYLNPWPNVTLPTPMAPVPAPYPMAPIHAPTPTAPVPAPAPMAPVPATTPIVPPVKASWTDEEDKILREKRALYGPKWSKIAKHLPGRRAKQCRERFVNILNPELKKGNWTDDEEAILIAMHEHLGNKWVEIAKYLPGRTDNDAKNHWNCNIKRKFQQHGKEKLIEAAMQQAQSLYETGRMPTQQSQYPSQPLSFPPGPYTQVLAPPPMPHPLLPPYAASAYPRAPTMPTEIGQGAPGPGSVGSGSGARFNPPPPPPPPPHLFPQMPPPYHFYGPPPPGDGGAGLPPQQLDVAAGKGDGVSKGDEYGVGNGGS